MIKNSLGMILAKCRICMDTFWMEDVEGDITHHNSKTKVTNCGPIVDYEIYQAESREWY